MMGNGFWTGALERIRQHYILPEVGKPLLSLATNGGMGPPPDVDLQDAFSRRLVNAMLWVHDTFEYRDDFDQFGEYEHWQTPDELLRNGGGDCEDLSFLLASIISNLNVPFRVVYGRMKVLHVWVEAFGRTPVLLDTSKGKWHDLSSGRYPKDYEFIMTVYESDGGDKK